jgi:TRAP transporter TAXI family solute receptor
MNKVSRALGLVTLAASLTLSAQAETLRVGTNQQGSLFYSLGTALSKVMVEKTDNQYRVSPYAGSSTYIPMLNSGRLEFGFANGGEATFAYLGTESFDRGANENLRLVGVMIATQTSFAVPSDSSAKTMEDLAGMRVPSGYNSGRTFHYYSEAAFGSSSIGIDDTKKVPMPNFVSAITALSENRVDAALVPMNAGAGQKAMATMPNGWRYLSLDDSEKARAEAAKNLPSARIVSVSPSDSKTGVVADPTNMIEVDFYLITGAHVSDEVVYDLVKTMASSTDELGNAFGAFKRYSLKNMVQENVVPYHDGAVKAFKELGVWSE